MNDSILNTIKKLLGLADGYPAFDADIVMHINTYLAVLNQIGVGVSGFSIEDATSTWRDFLLPNMPINLNEVKTYLYLRVRQVFDPPTSSILAQAITENIAELEWRLREEVEYNDRKGE